MDDYREESVHAVDLNTCDLEPIHTPGRVQPFGVLLAGPVDLSEVQYVSKNLEDICGLTPGDVLGGAFSDILSDKAVHDLRNALASPTARTQRERVGTFDVNDKAFEIYAHVNPQGLALLEFEAADDGTGASYPVDQMRQLLAAAHAGTSIDKLLRVSVAGLQSLTGFDRVMAYRYEDNGDGEVVAEAVVPGLTPFLGLRYPAWDVPEQARALQVKNPLRMLVDINQTPVPMLAHSTAEKPLDMSFAHLRGVSDIHVEYLRNMGVGATMTIGLVVEGRLWGMFSCHHSGPKIISSDLRIAVELFGQVASLLIKEKQDAAIVQRRNKAIAARERITSETMATTDLLNAFPKMAPILSEIVESDGLAVIYEGKTLTYGSTPSPATVNLFEGVDPTNEDLILTINNLSDSVLGPECDFRNSGGAMLVRATAAFPLQLVYFRDEITRALKWAGRPEKKMEDGPLGPRISPRQSFESYIEKTQGYCNPWTPGDVATAKDIQILLTQIVARGERVQLERHKDVASFQRQQDLMIAELNHRVKNILALIKSLSRQAKSSSASLESYALALEQRIAALAAAHDLAVSNTMQGVSLRGIVETELAPYLGAETSQVLMTGPLTGLRSDVAPIIALVLHEIVSNAAKYGALSTPDGIARVKWGVNEDGGLDFEWREIGGPQVFVPERHGFGRSLIEKAIPFELDGKAALEFPETGVNFKFWLPDEALVDVDAETAPKLQPHVAKIARIGAGKRALLVEDNIVLAMDMVDTLSRLGAEEVRTAATLEQGMELCVAPDLDFAVLDMNLRGVVSMDLADKLLDLGMPFVFVTGYGSKIEVPSRMEGVPILTKPIDESTLSRTIEALLKAGGKV